MSESRIYPAICWPSLVRYRLISREFFCGHKTTCVVHS